MESPFRAYRNCSLRFGSGTARKQKTQPGPEKTKLEALK